MASRITDSQYRAAVAQFARNPDPRGTMLNWVCRDDLDYLDVDADPLVLNPAVSLGRIRATDPMSTVLDVAHRF